MNKLMMLVVVTFATLFIGAATWQDSDAKPEPEPMAKTWDANSVREVAIKGYRKWGDARVAYDRETLESMVAPDLYIQLADRRITGEEFITTVSQKRPGAALTRFDVDVLTVQKTPDTENEWVLVIQEKLEWKVDGAGEDQAPVMYSVWITKDGWRFVDGKWLITFSEEIGHEYWRGPAKPQIEGW
jgi:hypothetical protein